MARSSIPYWAKDSTADPFALARSSRSCREAVAAMPEGRPGRVLAGS